MIDSGKVKIKLLPERKGLYIKTRIKKGDNRAESVIRDLHDNTVSLKLNGKSVKNSSLLSKNTKQKGKNNLAKLETWLKDLKLKDLLEMVDHLDRDDMDFLEEGVRYNMRLAENGLKHGQGLGVGKTLERLVRQGLIKKDMILAARILTSAAADARMAGVICDGAKGGCALKLATAAGTAVQSALFSLQGVNVMATDGIIGASPEKTMENIGTLSTQGMIETDRIILKIMIDKQFTDY